MESCKRYLGDGVYAAVENGMVKLTTEGGFETNNVIYLEPDVIDSLLKYIEENKENVNE